MCDRLKRISAGYALGVIGLSFRNRRVLLCDKTKMRTNPPFGDNYWRLLSGRRERFDRLVNTSIDVLGADEVDNAEAAQ